MEPTGATHGQIAEAASVLLDPALRLLEAR
jgi:hypothetical protein